MTLSNSDRGPDLHRSPLRIIEGQRCNGGRPMNENQRTRTFNWQDSSIGTEAARRMSGMDHLLSMFRKGELPLPPIMVALGFDEKTPEVEPGKVAFFFNGKEFHDNGLGSVHGGVICTLLDSAMGCAVES